MCVCESVCVGGEGGSCACGVGWGGENLRLWGRERGIVLPSFSASHVRAKISF